MREKITSLVQQALSEFLSRTTNETERRNILVLLVYQSSEPNVVWENLRLLSEKHQLTLYTSKHWSIPENLSFTKVVDLKGAEEEALFELVDENDLLYIPTVSYGLITKLALTIDDDLPSWLGIQMQFAGKEILIADDNLHVRKGRNFFVKPSIEKRIKSYYRGLHQDGVSIHPMKKTVQKIDSVFANSVKKRPVILAKHMEDLARSGENAVVIPRGSILTPMAKDAARELGIKLKVADEKRDDQ